MKARFVSAVPFLKVPIDPGKVEIVSTTTGNVKRVRHPRFVVFRNNELITEDEEVIRVLREKIRQGIARFKEVKTYEELEKEREKAEKRMLEEKYHICLTCGWKPPSDSKNPGAALWQHIRHNHPEVWEERKKKMKEEELKKLEEELDRFPSEKRGKKGKIYTCKKCGMEFVDLDKYREHLLTAHRQKKSEENKNTQE